MFIRIGKIRGIDKVEAFLREVPRGAMRAAVYALAEYIVGDDSHGLAHDDPYKYVTRKQAYGETFQSEAQRRKVMAMISSGEITPGQRYQSPTEQSSGYEIQSTNQGYGATIKNSSEGAYWTRVAQPAQLAMVGWRSYIRVVEDNIKGAVRHALAEVNKWLRTKGK